MGIRSGQKGFTVVEMIVVVGIISIFLSMLVLNRNQGISAVELKNAAHDAALLVRNAQTIGSNGRVDTNTGNTVPYGIHIVPGGQSFSLFVDEDGSLSYSTGEATYKQYTTPSSNIVIQSFCVYDRLGTNSDCYSQANRSLDIVYYRPSVSPVISVFKPGASPLVGTDYKKAVIYLGVEDGSAQPQGFVVESEGLIYVE